MIRPPFADYHRAELERLVQEGFDEIEERAAAVMLPCYWIEKGVMGDLEFQVLMAADAYLRSTKREPSKEHP